MFRRLPRTILFPYTTLFRSGNFYVGCSTDFEARFSEHEQGTACRTTAIGMPLDRFGAIRGCFLEIHGGATQSAHELLPRSEEHTSELQSLTNLVCRLLLEKK